MPTLEIGIDASRFTSGVQAVEQGGRQLQQTMERSATSVDRVRTSLSSAFQFTGGTVQIAQGIAQTARSFGELNTAAAAFSASRVLLEIGQTARDFTNLRGQVGGTVSAWGLLGAAFRANPIGIIATGVGLAATAMALFGDNARKAATDFDALAASVDKARLFDVAGAAIGGRSGTLGGARMGAIQNALIGAYGGEVPSIANLVRISGNQDELMHQLALAGNPQAIEWMQSGTGTFTTQRLVPTRFGERREWMPFQTTDLSSMTITADQASRALEGVGRYWTNAGAGDRTALGPMGFGSPMFVPGASAAGDGLDIYGRSFGHPGVEQSAEERARLEEQNYERSVQASEQIRRNFEAAGQEIGSVVANIVLAGGGIRDILAGLVRQGAGSAITQGFGMLGQALGGVAGSTATQQNQNIATPGGV